MQVVYAKYIQGGVENYTPILYVRCKNMPK